MFKNTEKYLGINQKSGLTYDPNETLSGLVNKSTTGDGIPDWEKVLFGLDPTKKENVPGVPDSVTIQKMIQENNSGVQIDTGSQNDSNLTQTDKFSKDLLATISTLTENGAIDANGNMDQATQDQLSNSLINNIQNTTQRKTYQLSDIKVINDNSVVAIKKYNTTLNSFSPKNSTNYTVMDVLQKFAPDDTGNNTDPSVLPELNPIVTQLTNLRDGMIHTPVPQSLSSLHLNSINALEGVIENLNDIQQYNTDPIVAFSGISKYEQDSTLFMTNFQKLVDTVNKAL